MIETIRIPGRDLRIGDVVVFLGNVHRVDRLDPYIGTLLSLLGEGTRVAVAGDWEMTVPPGQGVEILVRPEIGTGDDR